MNIPAGVSEKPIRPSVLIVDDRRENRVALGSVLSCPEYRLVEASSGEEALRCMLAEEYAVLLVDILMPNMDGFELAATIKARQKTAAVPIIFVTAEASDVHLVYKGYQIGAVDYLVKPLVPDMVRAKVAVFAELYRQRKRFERQGSLLIEAERRSGELKLVELRLARERRQWDDAEANVRERQKLLGTAARELQTLLSSLQVDIGTLGGPPGAAAQAGLSHGEMRQKIESATRQVEQLSQLVAELADASAIAAKPGLEMQRVDLAALATDVLRRFRNEADKAGCAVTLKAPMPVVGWWDRLRMERMVTHLFEGALESGAHRPVELAVFAEGASALLILREGGAGIPPTALSLVRHIVESHGGTIRVDGTADGGTTLTIELGSDLLEQGTENEPQPQGASPRGTQLAPR